jgi:hypothetical protein
MKRIRVILIPLIAAIAALMPSASAFASSDQCQLGGTSAFVLLTNSSNLCLDTHGVGAQLTIESQNQVTCAVLTFHDHTVNGAVYVSMVDGNGNCIREHSDKGVYVNSGNCNVDGSSPDMHELWFPNPIGLVGCAFTNGGENNIMIVTNNKAGNKVWGGQAGGSNWDNWEA